MGRTRRAPLQKKGKKRGGGGGGGYVHQDGAAADLVETVLVMTFFGSNLGIFFRYKHVQYTTQQSFRIF